VRNAESGATLEWGTKMASTVRGKRERERFRAKQGSICGFKKAASYVGLIPAVAQSLSQR
jgi:hypothetical protein